MRFTIASIGLFALYAAAQDLSSLPSCAVRGDSALLLRSSLRILSSYYITNLQNRSVALLALLAAPAAR